MNFFPQTLLSILESSVPDFFISDQLQFQLAANHHSERERSRGRRRRRNNQNSFFGFEYVEQRKKKERDQEEEEGIIKNQSLEEKGERSRKYLSAR